MSSGDLPDVGDTTIEEPDDSDYRRNRAYLLCAAGLAAIVFVVAFVGLVWVR